MDRTRDQTVAALLAAGVVAAPVNTAADLTDDPHVAARKMLQPTQTRELGTIATVGNPINVASSPVKRDDAALPALGQHTEEVLCEQLGISGEQLRSLRDSHVIGG